MSTRQSTDVVQFGPTSRPRPTSGCAATCATSGCSTSAAGAARTRSTFAKQGAHVIAVDHDGDALADGRALADAPRGARRVARQRRRRPRVPPRRLDRPRARRRAAHRGRRRRPAAPPGASRAARRAAPFVFSYEHPMALAVSRDDVAPGGLPLGRLEVRRSYFEPGPIHVTRDGEERTAVPAHDERRVRGAAPRRLPRRRAARARARALRRPRTRRVPTAIIWRARKEGV